MTDRNEGEGSYTAAKQFRDAQHQFAKSGRAPQKGREAAEAVDGAEAEELERARRAAADGESL